MADAIDELIDSQPTLIDGLVIVGPALAMPYAFNSDTCSGVEICRRWQGRDDREHGQLTSPWPINGSVTVIDQGLCYCWAT